MSQFTTRPRLVFESSEGVTVMYGEERCTELELVESFFSDKLVFGNPPYRIDVRAVPIEQPFLTFEQLVEG